MGPFRCSINQTRPDRIVPNVLALGCIVRNIPYRPIMEPGLPSLNPVPTQLMDLV